jgi:hypothetical protein
MFSIFVHTVQRYVLCGDPNALSDVKKEKCKLLLLLLSPRATKLPEGYRFLPVRTYVCTYVCMYVCMYDFVLSSL